MRAQHPPQHQCGIFTNNAAPIIGFSSSVESPQSKLPNTWPGPLRSPDTGPSMLETELVTQVVAVPSFIVFIRAHGQSLVQVMAVSLAHMATPTRTATVTDIHVPTYSVIMVYANFQLKALHTNNL